MPDIKAKLIITIKPPDAYQGTYTESQHREWASYQMGEINEISPDNPLFKVEFEFPPPEECLILMYEEMTTEEKLHEYATTYGAKFSVEYYGETRSYTISFFCNDLLLRIVKTWREKEKVMGTVLNLVEAAINKKKK